MTEMPEYGSLPLAMGDATPSNRLYLSISGGLDSAYLSWRLLQLGYRLVLHHCRYRTPGNRWRQEDAATDAVLDWLRRRGLDNYERLDTAVDVRRGVRYRLIDQETMLWIASVHLRPHEGEQHKGRPDPRADIGHIVLPIHHEANEGFGEPRFDRAWRMFELLMRRPVTPLLPMYEHSKRKMLTDMPPELIDLCFWCREPRGGMPCHRCYQCRVVDATLAEMEAAR